ncbi:MAG: hypothetical protein RBG13Loki_4227 [Promethearchaeota archaeon CR_4]|nr:MAG: hypothetical protein RBG13Loki_4227 [Candidatus Lokiarchaeota archaeon CR_4]
MGKHTNRSAIERIEHRLGTKERGSGVDFVTRGRAYEYADRSQDVQESVGQLQRSRAPGSKTLIVPQNLVEKAIEETKGTGIGIENISGTQVKKPRRV